MLLVSHSSILPPVLVQALRENYEVVVIGRVGEGKEALALALALRPQVILVELAEFGLTGLTTIAQLRAALPEVGIIVLIALANRSYWEVILAAGADEVVSNATLGTDLMPAIRRVV